MILIHDHKRPTAGTCVLSVHLPVFTVPHSEKAISSFLFPFC